MRSRPRTALLLCLALVAAAVLPVLAGCGSDDQQVEATVKRFYQAAARGDGKAACDELTAAARGPGGSGQCVAAIDQLGSLGGDEARKRLAAVSVRNTKVNGDRATTQAQVPTQTPVTLQLRKVDGDWKLESLGTQPGGV